MDLSFLICIMGFLCSSAQSRSPELLRNRDCISSPPGWWRVCWFDEWIKRWRSGVGGAWFLLSSCCSALTTYPHQPRLSMGQSSQQDNPRIRFDGYRLSLACQMFCIWCNIKGDDDWMHLLSGWVHRSSPPWRPSPGPATHSGSLCGPECVISD